MKTCQFATRRMMSIGFAFGAVPLAPNARGQLLQCGTPTQNGGGGGEIDYSEQGVVVVGGILASMTFSADISATDTAQTKGTEVATAIAVAADSLFFATAEANTPTTSFVDIEAPQEGVNTMGLNITGDTTGEGNELTLTAGNPVEKNLNVFPNQEVTDRRATAL